MVCTLVITPDFRFVANGFSIRQQVTEFITEPAAHWRQNSSDRPPTTSKGSRSLPGPFDRDPKDRRPGGRGEKRERRRPNCYVGSWAGPRPLRCLAARIGHRAITRTSSSSARWVPVPDRISLNSWHPQMNSLVVSRKHFFI